ncbi:MAG: ArsR/SmtB family transcription factor [Mycobacterium sp.]|jgi:DNA-binding transcriptional ArsR family regulator
MLVALGVLSRLRIVDLLRAGPVSVGAIAEALGIRQPQVSKHPRVLGDWGLVGSQAQARQRIYQIEAAPFEDIGRRAPAPELMRRRGSGLI